jgi:hypothetical protein
MVVNLQKEVLEMNQWLRRKRRICANGRQSLEVCCCERRNGSVFSVFKYDRTSLYRDHIMIILSEITISISCSRTS